MPQPTGPKQGIDYIALDGIARRYPDRAVLHDVSLTVSPGERVALVGENGVGKSTLLRIAAGIDEPDAGTAAHPASTSLFHQVLPFPMDATIAQVIEAAAAQARAVEHDLSQAADLLGTLDQDAPRYAQAAARYDQALAVANLTDVWSLDSRVDAVIGGLGLGGIPRDRPVGQISGGQRSRLALAAMLVAHPIALLMDEPTNHLDDAGADFLAAQLAGWGGPVLFASHDRTFLDRVATKVVDLDPSMGPHRPGQEIVGIQGASYSGNYTDYLVAKTAARERWAAQYASEQELRKDLQHTAAVSARNVMHTTTPRTEARGSKKFYSDKASTVVARRVHSAESRLDALEREQVAKPPEPLRFKGFASRPAPPPGETLVDLQGVAVQGRLAPTDLVVHGTDRILLTGPNGSGKSTLLAVLVGSLAADAGARLVRGGTRIGLLAQEMRWPRPDRTVLDTYRDATSAVFPPPSLKATGLIAPRDLNRPLGSLSVGQQRRLELAVILADPPDILLLDEPTNHLSLALTEELEAALPDYPGAVIVATHDRWLRDRWPGPQVRIGSA